ncbi:hypothetical protein ACFFK0_08380 [Paenibacillus chartarius]|uniref:Uncharacterized protein n=1 Tax=Paenibacillus chartarius TaxID=747481 RepID=A0ABV6DIP9_9BACL
MLTFSLNKTFTDIEIIREIYPVIVRPLTSAKAREWLTDFCLRPIDGKSNKGRANDIEAFAAVCDRNTFYCKIRSEVAMLDEDEAKRYPDRFFGKSLHMLRSSDSSESSSILEDFEVICEIYRLVSDFLADEKSIALHVVMSSALSGKPWGVKKLVKLFEKYNDFEAWSDVKYLYKGGKMTSLSHRVSTWMQENDFKTLLLIIIENDELLERLNLFEYLPPIRRVY